MEPAAKNSIVRRVRNAQAWAERQFSRASQFIRTASMSTDATSTEISAQVEASDGNFFEQFMSYPTGHPADTSNDIVNNENVYIREISVNEDEKALEDLYVEALYTIVHKLGCSASHKKLIGYVKQSFAMEDQRHKRLMFKATEEKPPVVLLNVILLEARNLIAKDINGFSDPFSMLGVVPGKNSNLKAINGTNRINTPDTDCSGADSDSLTTTPTSPRPEKQRFGGSFRRKAFSKKQIKASKPEEIPAKFIKASSVQKKTLNPKWNEKFQFTVDDINTDEFHMDIWDMDDEERSVVDAVTSLNQVVDFKGLTRYFKQVAQSARVGSDECVDDFLGSVNLKVKDIPSTGLEDWFTLEKRSEKSKVSGEVKLKLWLSTREEPSNRDDDDLTDVEQHVKLIQQFSLYEMKQSAVSLLICGNQICDIII